MARVGRYVKFTARTGEGEALAQLLLRVAEGQRSAPGCELYVINHEAGAPDVVWVTELWASQDAVDAALQELRSEAGRAQLAEVQALLADAPQRTDLVPVGGVLPTSRGDNSHTIQT
jgi:quinol monooxygenase YgiN